MEPARTYVVDGRGRMANIEVSERQLQEHWQDRGGGEIGHRCEGIERMDVQTMISISTSLPSISLSLELLGCVLAT